MHAYINYLLRKMWALLRLGRDWIKMASCKLTPSPVKLLETSFEPCCKTFQNPFTPVKVLVRKCCETLIQPVEQLGHVTFPKQYKKSEGSAAKSFEDKLFNWTDEMFTCGICKKAFGRLANLRRHENNLHSNRQPTAPRPSTSTASNTERRPCFNEIVDDDTVFEHGCIVLECDRCIAYFLDQEQLDKHEKVYTHW